MKRLAFLCLTAGAGTLLTFPRVGRPQTYPTRPVRIVVGFAPGGAQDVLARLIGQWLSEKLGQQFLVENRAGGGGNVAVEAVVNANPDGHTLLLVGPPNAINATLYTKLSFNFLRDVAPVGSIVRVANVMEVYPAFAVTSVPEFISYAKAHPGAISFASAGVGTGPHLAGELFKMMAAVDIVHVPYRGERPALGDLIGGHVQAMFGVMASSVPHVRSGELRALAVTSASRSSALPDVPTVADFVPGYEATAAFGLGAPRNTPPEIINKLNQAINEAFVDPTMRDRIADFGGTRLPGSPADFGKLMADETEKWGEVVKFSGAKAE